MKKPKLLLFAVLAATYFSGALVDASPALPIAAEDAALQRRSPAKDNNRHFTDANVAATNYAKSLKTSQSRAKGEGSTSGNCMVRNFEDLSHRIATMGDEDSTMLFYEDKIKGVEKFMQRLDSFQKTGKFTSSMHTITTTTKDEEREGRQCVTIQIDSILRKRPDHHDVELEKRAGRKRQQVSKNASSSRTGVTSVEEVQHRVGAMADDQSTMVFYEDYLPRIQPFLDALEKFKSSKFMSNAHVITTKVDQSESDDRRMVTIQIDSKLRRRPDHDDDSNSSNVRIEKRGGKRRKISKGASSCRHSEVHSVEALEDKVAKLAKDESTMLFYEDRQDKIKPFLDALDSFKNSRFMSNDHIITTKTRQSEADDRDVVTITIDSKSRRRPGHDDDGNNSARLEKRGGKRRKITKGAGSSQKSEVQSVEELGDRIAKMGKDESTVLFYEDKADKIQPFLDALDTFKGSRIMSQDHTIATKTGPSEADGREVITIQIDAKSRNVLHHFLQKRAGNGSQQDSSSSSDQEEEEEEKQATSSEYWEHLRGFEDLSDKIVGLDDEKSDKFHFEGTPEQLKKFQDRLRRFLQGRFAPISHIVTYMVTPSRRRGFQWITVKADSISSPPTVLQKRMNKEEGEPSADAATAARFRQRSQNHTTQKPEDVFHNIVNLAKDGSAVFFYQGRTGKVDEYLKTLQGYLEDLYRIDDSHVVLFDKKDGEFQGRAHVTIRAIPKAQFEEMHGKTIDLNSNPPTTEWQKRMNKEDSKPASAAAVVVSRFKDRSMNLTTQKPEDVFENIANLDKDGSAVFFYQGKTGKVDQYLKTLDGYLKDLYLMDDSHVVVFDKKAGEFEGSAHVTIRAIPKKQYEEMREKANEEDQDASTSSISSPPTHELLQKRMNRGVNTSATRFKDRSMDHSTQNPEDVFHNIANLAEDGSAVFFYGATTKKVDKYLEKLDGYLKDLRLMDDSHVVIFDRKAGEAEGRTFVTIRAIPKKKYEEMQKEQNEAQQSNEVSYYGNASTSSVWDPSTAGWQKRMNQGNNQQVATKGPRRDSTIRSPEEVLQEIATLKEDSAGIYLHEGKRKDVDTFWNTLKKYLENEHLWGQTHIVTHGIQDAEFRGRKLLTIRAIPKKQYEEEMKNQNDKTQQGAVAASTSSISTTTSGLQKRMNKRGSSTQQAGSKKPRMNHTKETPEEVFDDIVNLKEDTAGIYFHEGRPKDVNTFWNTLEKYLDNEHLYDGSHFVTHFIQDAEFRGRRLLTIRANPRKQRSQEEGGSTSGATVNEMSNNRLEKRTTKKGVCSGSDKSTEYYVKGAEDLLHKIANLPLDRGGMFIYEDQKADVDLFMQRFSFYMQPPHWDDTHIVVPKRGNAEGKNRGSVTIYVYAKPENLPPREEPPKRKRRGKKQTDAGPSYSKRQVGEGVSPVSFSNDNDDAQLEKRGGKGSKKKDPGSDEAMGQTDEGTSGGDSNEANYVNYSKKYIFIKDGDEFLSKVVDAPQEGAVVYVYEDTAAGVEKFRDKVHHFLLTQGQHPMLKGLNVGFEASEVDEAGHQVMRVEVRRKRRLPERTRMPWTEVSEDNQQLQLEKRGSSSGRLSISSTSSSSHQETNTDGSSSSSSSQTNSNEHILMGSSILTRQILDLPLDGSMTLNYENTAPVIAQFEHSLLNWRVAPEDSEKIAGLKIRYKIVNARRRGFRKIHIVVTRHLADLQEESASGIVEEQGNGSETLERRGVGSSKQQESIAGPRSSANNNNEIVVHGADELFEKILNLPRGGAITILYEDWTPAIAQLEHRLHQFQAEPTSHERLPGLKIHFFIVNAKRRGRQVIRVVATRDEERAVSKVQLEEVEEDSGIDEQQINEKRGIGSSKQPGSHTGPSSSSSSRRQRDSDAGPSSSSSTSTSGGESGKEIVVQTQNDVFDQILHVGPGEATTIIYEDSTAAIDQLEQDLLNFQSDPANFSKLVGVLIHVETANADTRGRREIHVFVKSDKAKPNSNIRIEEVKEESESETPEKRGVNSSREESKEIGSSNSHEEIKVKDADQLIHLINNDPKPSPVKYLFQGSTSATTQFEGKLETFLRSRASHHTANPYTVNWETKEGGKSRRKVVQVVLLPKKDYSDGAVPFQKRAGGSGSRRGKQPAKPKSDTLGVADLQEFIQKEAALPLSNGGILFYENLDWMVDGFMRDLESYANLRGTTIKHTLRLTVGSSDKPGCKHLTITMSPGAASVQESNEEVDDASSSTNQPN